MVGESGRAWSPTRYDAAGTVKPDSLDRSGQPIVDEPLGVANAWAKRGTLFAAGGDRVNAAPETAMTNTLLLREHNRTTGVIEANHPGWDGEQGL